MPRGCGWRCAGWPQLAAEAAASERARRNWGNRPRLPAPRLRPFDGAGDKPRRRQRAGRFQFPAHDSVSRAAGFRIKPGRRGWGVGGFAVARGKEAQFACAATAAGACRGARGWGAFLGVAVIASSPSSSSASDGQGLGLLDRARPDKHGAHCGIETLAASRLRAAIELGLHDDAPERHRRRAPAGRGKETPKTCSGPRFNFKNSTPACASPETRRGPPCPSGRSAPVRRCAGRFPCAEGVVDLMPVDETHQRFCISDRAWRGGECQIGEMFHHRTLNAASSVDRVLREADLFGVGPSKPSAGREQRLRHSAARSPRSHRARWSPGVRPRRTSEKRNFVALSAMATSQAATRPAPPPMAAPCTNRHGKLRQVVQVLQHARERQSVGFVVGARCARRRAASSQCRRRRRSFPRRRA